MLNLKVFCMAHDINARALAKRVEVNPTYIINVWNQAQRPSPRLKRLIAETLGVDEGVLFKEFDPKVLQAS